MDFQIDIGVVNLYEPSNYLLGIMLDGETYAMDKDEITREIVKLLGYTRAIAKVVDVTEAAIKAAKAMGAIVLNG